MSEKKLYLILFICCILLFSFTVIRLIYGYCIKVININDIEWIIPEFIVCLVLGYWYYNADND